MPAKGSAVPEVAGDQVVGVASGRRRLDHVDLRVEGQPPGKVEPIRSPQHVLDGGDVARPVGLALASGLAQAASDCLVGNGDSLAQAENRAVLRPTGGHGSLAYAYLLAAQAGGVDVTPNLAQLEVRLSLGGWTRHSRRPRLASARRHAVNVAHKES